jgi:hypothetical protein
MDIELSKDMMPYILLANGIPIEKGIYLSPEVLL